MKTVTINVAEDVYNGLKRMAGAQGVGEFIENLLRRQLPSQDKLEAGYRSMSQNNAREAEALEWSEALIGDSHDAAR